jgi:DNA-directed RNA polymerase specialized sigma24 family protein
MATASDQERLIHSKILQGDDLAFAMFCDAFYEGVYQKVKAFHQAIYDYDETIIMDVVTDSFLKYFKQPDRYNPEKQSLEKFLIMDAEGDLLNTWEKINRGNKKIKKVVALDDENRNSEIEGHELTPLGELLNKENQALLEKKLSEVFKQEKDILLAHLLLSGERKSSEYAKVLEIEHLPDDEQRQEVKRNKDRIDKVIKRKLSEQSNR